MSDSSERHSERRDAGRRSDSPSDRALDLAFDLRDTPKSDRAEAIERACVGDQALARQVTALLAAADDTGDFLDQSAATAVSTEELLQVSTEPEGMPEIPGYQIIAELGRGGMGVVYQAIDLENANRSIALKVLPPLFDQAARVRFDDECRAMANLVHPNIATLYHSGIAGDRPFVAMELIDGLPIDEFCDAHALSIDQRIQLVEQVCFATAHAHERRMLHQDIKPSNLLVTSATGSTALVKVIDFGIAAVLGDAQTTQIGRSSKGSIGYVSPERAENPQSFRADTREDVYAIGAVLFKLLSGSTPSVADRGHGGDLNQTISLLTSTQQQHAATSRRLGVRRWTKLMDGDLRRITAKALALDRNDRYRSPLELAEDLRRYRFRLPVSARPGSWLYRSRLFLRRRWGVATAVATLAVTLLTASFVSIDQARLARIAQAESEEVSDFVKDLFAQANPTVENPEGVTAVELLERGLRRAESQLAGQPALLARVLEVIGTSYAGLGRFDLARDTLIRAVEVGNPVLDSQRAGNLWLALGDAHMKLADFDASMRAYDRAEVLLGEARPDFAGLAKVLNSRANILFRQLNYEGAEVLHRQAYEMRSEHLGEFALDTGVSANNVAAMLMMRRQQAAAEPFLRKARSIFQTHLPPTHAWLDQVETNLATSLGLQRQLEEANALRVEVLARQQQRLGDVHPALISNLTNTSDTLREMGRLYDASEYLDRAENIASLSFEAGHPERLRIVARRGALALARMDFDAAIAHYQDCLAGYEALYGANHRLTALQVQKIGRVHLRAGHYEQAARWLSDAREVLSSLLSNSHHLVLSVDRERLELALLTGENAAWANDLLARHGSDTIRESERFRAALLDARLRQRSEPSQAIARLEDELSDVSEQVSPYEEAQGWAWLANAYTAEGRDSEAKRAAQNALALLDDEMPVHDQLASTLAMVSDR